MCEVRSFWFCGINIVANTANRPIKYPPFKASSDMAAHHLYARSLFLKIPQLCHHAPPLDRGTKGTKGGPPIVDHELTAAATRLPRGEMVRQRATSSDSAMSCSSSSCLLACVMNPRDARCSLARKRSFSCRSRSLSDFHWPPTHTQTHR